MHGDVEDDEPGGDGRRRPSIERWHALSRAQRALATAVGAAVVAAVGWGVNAGMPKLVDWLNGPEDNPVATRLLIVDTSSAMTGSLGRRSKFAAVRSQITTLVGRTPDVAFALRTVGGGCGGGYQEPRVKFASRDGSAIVSALAGARVGGRADIASAVSQGTDDFQRFKIARTAHIQSIWLFIGGARNTCEPNAPPVGPAIKLALIDSPAQVSYVDLFVLRGDKNGYANLRRNVESLGSTFAVSRVTTEPALRNAVQRASRRESASR
jgi:hypothetical protein